VREDSTLLLTFDPYSDLVAKVARFVCVAVFHQFECTPLGCIGVHFVPRAEYSYYVLVSPSDMAARGKRTSQWLMVAGQGRRMSIPRSGELFDSILVVPEVYTFRQGVCSFRVTNAMIGNTDGYYGFWQDLRSTLLAICVIWRLERNMEQAQRLEQAIAQLMTFPESIAMLRPYLLHCSPSALGAPFWNALRY
jgi:hypothetical protein